MLLPTLLKKALFTQSRYTLYYMGVWVCVYTYTHTPIHPHIHIERRLNWEINMLYSAPCLLLMIIEKYIFSFITPRYLQIKSILS